MPNEAQIGVGSIVKYKYTKGDRNKEGHYRVSSFKGGKVNLKSIFGKTIYFKSIPVDQVMEDEKAWHEGWQKSETYMCM